MSIGTVFVNNGTQAVRPPVDVRPPEGVQKVDIRVKGKERITPPSANAGTASFWMVPQ
jgi:antitoxin VapB